MHAGKSLVYVAATVYWAVLIAELIGDKTIYTVTSLAGRFRKSMVLLAILAAYAIKMAFAALFGSVLGRIDAPRMAMISALAFFVSAVLVIIRQPPEKLETTAARDAGACFAALFLTEWGDPGQLAAAACSATFHAPLLVWVAGTLAMATKGGLALIVGLKLRSRLPQPLLRRCAAATLLVLGVLSLTQLKRF